MKELGKNNGANEDAESFKATPKCHTRTQTLLRLLIVFTQIWLLFFCIVAQRHWILPAAGTVSVLLVGVYRMKYVHWVHTFKGLSKSVQNREKKWAVIMSPILICFLIVGNNIFKLAQNELYFRIGLIFLVAIFVWCGAEGIKRMRFWR